MDKLGPCFLLSTLLLAYVYRPVLCARLRRVVGGRPLDAGGWPWLVSLQFQGHHPYLELQGLKHLCGGTLVGDDWVLTAAHCVDNRSGSDSLSDPGMWRVIIGEHDRGVAEGTEQTKEVDSIYTYEGYTLSPGLARDLALLKLKTPVQITSHVQPIALDTDRSYDAGTICSSAGWGQHVEAEPGQPQYGNGTLLPHVVEVKVVSESACAQAYVGLPITVDSSVLCFNSDTRSDTCQGDSGGPLVCEGPHGKPVLTAIVSVGKGCANPSFPGVYTRVAAYKDWILNIMGQQA